MRMLKVKFDKTLCDGEHDYYVSNIIHLREQIRRYVTEVNCEDFIFVTRGFNYDGRKAIENVIGVKRTRLSELIELKIIPQLMIHEEENY